MTSTRREAGGGAHVDDVVVDQQVAAFDELDAHLLRKKGVLEVGGVGNAGSEQNRCGVVAIGTIIGREACEAWPAARCG